MSTKETQPDYVPPLSPPASPRVGWFEVNILDNGKNAPFEYPDNFIRTSQYTLLSFLPKNLFEQFSKAGNMYFTLNMILALIPGASPITPATAVAPLSFVILVALIKDGWEDYLRHRADDAANSAVCYVVREGKRVEIQSRDVRAGDILRIHKDEEIRCDCIILDSADPQGNAYIDTAQLDGETNVKPRKAKDYTMGKYQTYDDIASIKNMLVLADKPSPSLITWKGVLHHDDIKEGSEQRGARHALGIEQFLFRGAVLRNTDWCFGAVVYTGVNTKMFRNLKKKPPKFSSLDKKLNKMIIFIFLFKHVIMFVLCGMAIWWNDTSENRNAWYLSSFIHEHHGVAIFGWRYLTYFILLSFMIPISLFVTMELCKASQSVLMYWDLAMSREMPDGTTQYCRPKTSNLNEQLALVQYVFTDKTGTLTENVMLYVGGTIGPSATPHDDLREEGKLQSRLEESDVLQYLTALALCNSVIPFKKGEEAVKLSNETMWDPTTVTNPKAELHSSEFKYEGQSPDEIALVRAAERNGVILAERTSRTIVLYIDGSPFEYDILAELPFTPERKMMSMIVRDESGRIVQFTKGSDASMLPRLASGVQATASADALTQYSSIGLRTLVVGYRYLTEAEFAPWLYDYLNCQCAMDNRIELVHESCLKIEQNLEILGTTAIEDKLQEGVPETIRFMLDAGIIIWMLTGDKRETAVNIAASCGLLNPQTDKVTHFNITHNLPPSGQPSPELQAALESVSAQLERQSRVCIVIDGESLQVAMEAHLDLFMKVGRKVTCAVCCRLTPLNKANVVKNFQESGSTALAIGDGANDVSMIQEGRVGIGIMGLEGSQAELASDYAIPRFRHLRRLLFVHGRYALYRNASCISYSFYKNTTMAFTQVYFAYFAGFSGITLFNSWLLATYNVIFSFLVPLVMGIFEKDLPEEILETNPQLYKPLSQGLYFNRRSLAMWLCDIFLQSTVVFWFLYPTMQNDAMGEKNGSIEHYGTSIITCVVMCIDVRVLYYIRYWTWIPAFCLVISFVGYFGFTLGYSAIFILSLDDKSEFYYVMYHLFSTPSILLYWVLVSVGFLTLTDLGGNAIQRYLYPTLRDLAQYAGSQVHEPVSPANPLLNPNPSKDTELQIIPGEQTRRKDSLADRLELGKQLESAVNRSPRKFSSALLSTPTTSGPNMPYGTGSTPMQVRDQPDPLLQTCKGLAIDGQF